jgi:circadian clock protein KaiC
LSQQSRELAEEQAIQQELDRKTLTLEHRHKAVEAQIEALRAGFLAEKEELARAVSADQFRKRQIQTDQRAIATRRGVAESKKPHK